jgi:hypothetical protein
MKEGNRGGLRGFLLFCRRADGGFLHNVILFYIIILYYVKGPTKEKDGGTTPFL